MSTCLLAGEPQSSDSSESLQYAVQLCVEVHVCASAVLSDACVSKAVVCWGLLLPQAMPDGTCMSTRPPWPDLTPSCNVCVNGAVTLSPESHNQSAVAHYSLSAIMFLYWYQWTAQLVLRMCIHVSITHTVKTMLNVMFNPQASTTAILFSESTSCNAHQCICNRPCHKPAVEAFLNLRRRGSPLTPLLPLKPEGAETSPWEVLGTVGG